jgi:hypothetical protein
MEEDLKKIKIQWKKTSKRIKMEDDLKINKEWKTTSNKQKWKTTSSIGINLNWL